MKHLIVYLVAMRHHDFANDLPSLYKRVKGKVVSLRKEDGNAWDLGKAVAAYFEFQLLGYVSGDEGKAKVRRLMDAMGRNTIRCIVKRVIIGKDAKKSDMLEAELINIEEEHLHACVECQIVEEQKIDWSLWAWDGPVLSQSKEENQLQAVVDELLEYLRDGNPDVEYLDEGMEMMNCLMWADLSKDIQDKYTEMLNLLSTNDETAEAADSLTQMNAHVGSPEMRKQVYDYLMESAKSDEVAEIIKREGYTLETLSGRIPNQMVQLFCTDWEKFVARVWYLGMPHNIWQGFMSSITYLLRCVLDQGMELAQNRMPIKERTMKVGQLMQWGEKLPVDIAHELCRLIMFENPMLTEDDLKELAGAFHAEIGEGGVVFSHCQVSGNNIVEKVGKPEELVKLPIAEQPILLPEKKGEGK